tara:strand:+ start:4531 stop:4863 length:333 start_codon:yes stop_codon:yes gene_type:complete
MSKPRLKMRGSNLRMAKPGGPAVKVVADRRISGRRLQDRRLSIWKRDPHCARCGRLVEFPGGFELDHVVPLGAGGEDVEANCQILCVDSADGLHPGCHGRKTAADLAGIR